MENIQKLKTFCVHPKHENPCKQPCKACEEECEVEYLVDELPVDES